MELVCRHVQYLEMRKLFFIRQHKEFLIILNSLDINKEGKVEEEEM